MNRNVQVTNFEDIQHYCDCTRRQASLSGLDVRTAPFEPAHTCNREAPSIGQDLWRQLKRVQIPVFHGDKKKKYQTWKAAFLACTDNASATAEYKLL